MKYTRALTNQYSLRHWSQIIEARNQSGQTISNFCESEGIATNTYYYWLRKLRTAALSSIDTGIETGTQLIPNVVNLA